jgi:hypothetical protein
MTTGHLISFVMQMWLHVIFEGMRQCEKFSWKTDQTMATLAKATHETMWVGMDGPLMKMYPEKNHKTLSVRTVGL